ncbi:MAG: hypothetical protein OHK0023_08080 [Anaerolineae bacterium]
MYERPAIIERIWQVAAGVQRFSLAVENVHRNLAAGQMLLARTSASYDPYLREPWIIVEKRSTHLVIERPSRFMYTPGQVVSVLGPVGKALPEKPNLRTALLLAYESSPTALLMFAAELLDKGTAVTLVLVGAARGYPLEALPAELEVIRAADHSLWAEKDRLLQWAELVIALAPPPHDLPAYGRLLDDITRIRIQPAAGFAYGLIQPPLPCGYGACGACWVRLKDGEEVATCTDGMAFDLLSLSLTPTTAPNV